MRLTVLGSGASYPGAAHACASYLVEHDGTAVLLDCGNGSLANLARLMDPVALDAVFITHGHVDHFADVFALQAALRWAPEGPCPPRALYLPDGLFERMCGVLTPRGAEDLVAAFDARPLRAAEAVTVGSLTVTPFEVDHIAPTFALRVDDGASSLCYTSDTAPGPSVTRAVSGARAIIADTTLPPAYEGRAPHLSAAQAGELAVAAGADTLVLSHMWPTVDRDEARARATEAFGGRVIVAEELASIDID